MRILVISHMRLLREALTAMLADREGIQAFGASSLEAIEAVAANARPGVAVVDALHPQAAALVAAVRVCVLRLSVAVLAMQDRDEDFLAWTNVGISGGSCWVPGWWNLCHATKPATRAPSRALPRRRALCTN